MKHLTLLFTCVLALVMVGSLAAQTYDTPQGSTAPASMSKVVNGIVVSSTASTLVLTTTNGEQMTFTVDSQSNIPASLSSGSEVRVEYHALTGGTNHAANVTAVATSPMTSTATTETTASDEDLPETAGPLPWILATGLAALGGAIGLRLIRRKK